MSGDAAVAVVDSIARIPARDWDRCAGAANPFVGHAFLAALEDSGSVGERTGWIPRHAVLQDPGGELVACAPLYLKTHSYGEYVFDHGWADAYAQGGVCRVAQQQPRSWDGRERDRQLQLRVI